MILIAELFFKFLSMSNIEKLVYYSSHRTQLFGEIEELIKERDCLERGSDERYDLNDEIMMLNNEIDITNKLIEQYRYTM